MLLCTSSLNATSHSSLLPTLCNRLHNHAAPGGGWPQGTNPQPRHHCSPAHAAHSRPRLPHGCATVGLGCAGLARTVSCTLLKCAVLCCSRLKAAAPAWRWVMHQLVCSMHTCTTHPPVCTLAGGEILLTDGVRAAYEEGKGGIQVRAKMHIEDGRWADRRGGWVDEFVCGNGMPKLPCKIPSTRAEPAHLASILSVSPLPFSSCSPQHHCGQTGQGQEVGWSGRQAAGGRHRAALSDQ